MTRNEYIISAMGYLENIASTVKKGHNISYQFNFFSEKDDYAVDELYFDLITKRWHRPNNKLVFKTHIESEFDDRQLDSFAKQLNDIITYHIKADMDLFNNKYADMCESYNRFKIDEVNANLHITSKNGFKLLPGGKI